MDTSRIDQDRVSLNMGPMQLVKAVQLILEILDPTISREDRQVQVHVADDVYVWVDDLRLRQVLLNVVGNALKYTPAASAIAITATCVDVATVKRRLTASQQVLSPVVTPDPDSATFALATPFVLIEVRDWGPGINAEERERLFTKFMRLDNAINSVQRGTGLGLYLCRQLIEAMAGHIWVESTGIPGEGSIFAIALPRYHH
jgi:signal transduction histidine kinase